MTVLTMLFLAPLIGLMPHAVLAGVVIVYSIGLIQPAEFRNILAIRRTEFIWAVAAFVGVMVLGTLEGNSRGDHRLARRARPADRESAGVRARPQARHERVPAALARTPDDESFPGVLLLRLEGRLFFLNAERVAQKIRPLIAGAKPKVVVLDLSAACSTSNIRR